jgi:hypothetical protein
MSALKTELSFWLPFWENIKGEDFNHNKKGNNTKSSPQRRGFAFINI